MPDAFSVKTEVFEGPLELLLELIEKRKLLINDISLASVTDDYIAYVHSLQERHIVDTAHFVLVAATLLLIKSKSLLPVLSLTEEEHKNIEDLEYRLKLYQIYRDYGLRIQEQFGTSLSYSKQYHPIQTPIFVPGPRAHLDILRESLWDVIRRLPVFTKKPHVSVQKIISLEEMIKNVEHRIQREVRLSFSEFISSKERRHVIVGFLAVLELVKQGSVLVSQERHFRDITIERSSIDTPRY